MPGAEKAPDKTMAQRAANALLKPKVAQKSADVGLFGDEMNQSDLLDFAAKKPIEKGPFQIVRDATGSVVGSAATRAEAEAIARDLPYPPYRVEPVGEKKPAPPKDAFDDI